MSTISKIKKDNITYDIEDPSVDNKITTAVETHGSDATAHADQFATKQDTITGNLNDFVFITTGGKLATGTKTRGGKQLSQENFTTAMKNKLNNITDSSIESISVCDSGMISCSTMYNIYTLRLTENTTISLEAPTLSDNKLYHCELYLYQPNEPVAITFDTAIYWKDDTIPTMTTSGVYAIGLDYNKNDNCWRGYLIGKYASSGYGGNLYEGDGGVYIYIDGSRSEAAESMEYVDVQIAGSTIYCISDGTTVGQINGGTVGPDASIVCGAWFYNDSTGESIEATGGTVSGMNIDGIVDGYNGKYFDCVFGSTSHPTSMTTAVTYMSCTFLSTDFTNDNGMLDGCTFTDCTFNGSVPGAYCTFTDCTFSGNGHLNGTAEGTYTGITVTNGGQVSFDGGTVEYLSNTGGTVNYGGMYGTIDGYTQTSGLINGLYTGGISNDDYCIKNFNITGGTIDQAYEGKLISGTITLPQNVSFMDMFVLDDVIFRPSGTSRYSIITGYGGHTLTDCVFGARVSVIMDESCSTGGTPNLSTIKRCTFESGSSVTLYYSGYNNSNDDDKNILQSGSTIHIDYSLNSVESGVWYAEAGVNVVFNWDTTSMGEKPSIRTDYVTESAGYITFSAQ